MQHPKNEDPWTVFLDTRRRLFFALGILVVVTGVGSFGYWWLGDGRWSFWDCIYMTAITITTVGYGEVLNLDDVPLSRTWTLLLLLFGISANLYTVSAITSFFVESDFANVRRYRRLVRSLARVEDHFVVCGAGRTGTHVIDELVAVGERVVIVDENPNQLDEYNERGVLTLVGDATDDEILQTAGVERARGLVVTLDDDKTNLFVVISARQCNPKLRIVAKAVSTTAVQKLRRAGANAVVAPTMIGGMRLASELIRPHVVRFLDEMLRDESKLRIEEAVVENGRIVGQTLAESEIHGRCGVLIMAIREPSGLVHHVPKADLVLKAGQTLIAIGKPKEIDALRRLVGDHRLRSAEPKTTALDAESHEDEVARWSDPPTD